MKQQDVYFSLGSNQGDRQARIEEALRRLDKALGRPYEALSSIIETPAWGFDKPPLLYWLWRFAVTAVLWPRNVVTMLYLHSDQMKLADALIRGEQTC